VGDRLPLPQHPRFGFVFWNDAHSLHATDVVELHDLGKLHGSTPIITSGWIMKDDDIGVSVCSEFCGGTAFRNSTFILKHMVQEIWYLPALPKKKPEGRKKRSRRVVSPVESAYNKNPTEA
jgi:hypothetical protein